VRRLNALPFLISPAPTLERIWGIESKVNIRTPWLLSQGQYDALVSFTYNEGAVAVVDPYSRLVGNPSVTSPNGQRRVRCGMPVTREETQF
jgi:hypothetical protein